jgi:phospholipid/cholesterol/gamma-HCH transport system permease protein
MVTRLWAVVSQRILRWVSIYYHIDVVGWRAIPIIGLISFLIGAVLAYQGINQLARFGAQIYTVDFLAVSVLREIAVLITSIVIAGRSGSAFTAQIGTMALNQEIDAIRVLGLSPMDVLVLPRVLALLVSLPLLVFFSMIMGLLGGMMLCFLIIDLSPLQFWIGVNKALSPSTFWVGISKTPLFAVIIALVGCFRGMQVSGSAESVGLMTTRSVVESIFLVIVFDALLSILFSSLDL